MHRLHSPQVRKHLPGTPQAGCQRTEPSPADRHSSGGVDFSWRQTDVRELPRTRMVLVREWTNLSQRIHATLAMYGLDVGASGVFGVKRTRLLRVALKRLLLVRCLVPGSGSVSAADIWAKKTQRSDCETPPGKTLGRRNGGEKCPTGAALRLCGRDQGGEQGLTWHALP